MKKPLLRYKRFWLLLVLSIIVGFLLMQRPVQIILQTASNKTAQIEALPTIPVTNIADWEAQKSAIRRQFETTLYGSYPKNIELIETFRGELGSAFLSGKAKVEVRQYELQNPINNEARRFGFVLVLPKDTNEPVPLILTQNFCPNHNVVPAEGILLPELPTISCDSGGFFSKIMTFVFGRHIVSPPFEDIIDRGYAVGVLHPPEFISDSVGSGQSALNQFFSDYSPSERPGALIAWAMQSVLLAADLKSDSRFENIAAWGHSRYGKTALLAGAYSEDLNAIIAHQSGTAGASPFRNNPGEQLSDVMSSYSHWMAGNAKTYVDAIDNLPIDQHHLLALLAPRPILLGNAKRDVWSDPEGSFRLAKAINEVSKLYGSDGLTQNRLNDFDPNSDVSFWMRGGTHGVVKEDWPAFLDFLDAHFK